ncbi:unnamed protein product [Rotaria magnacalcarata]|uniref:Rad60/SUMO-like domain-containing protein n=1 Tax=Rotaria magnacalcarata TaxID=392030 RepID=A0A816V1V2_9BILA|nr:unnamed protein product [Rotaria magnacalcarata]
MTTDSKTKEYIKLRVVGQDNSEVHFNSQMTTNLAKLKRSYAERQGVSAATLRPKQLEMEDNHTIEAYQELVGRCY